MLHDAKQLLQTKQSELQDTAKQNRALVERLAAAEKRAAGAKEEHAAARSTSSATATALRQAQAKLKLAVAEVLASEGFIQSVCVADDSEKPELVLELRYADSGDTIIDGLKRVSKPGRRVYVGAKEVARVRNGLGMSIISTSKGVLCDRDARAQKVGGEVLCEVW